MSSIPRDALKTSASKPGVIWVASSKLRALARAITSWGSEISAGGVFFVSGDTREVRTVEDRVLQRPGLEQGRLAPDLGDNIFTLREHVPNRCTRRANFSPVTGTPGATQMTKFGHMTPRGHVVRRFFRMGHRLQPVAGSR